MGEAFGFRRSGRYPGMVLPLQVVPGGCGGQGHRPPERPTLFDPRNFQHFLESSPLPIWVYDVATLRFVWTNAAAVARYGHTREAFEQMTILDIRPSHDRLEVARLSRSPQRGVANQPGIWVHVDKAGEQMDVRVTTVDLLPAGCGLRLALVEDVTSFTTLTKTLAHMASHDASTGLLGVPALTKTLDEGALGPRYRLAYLRLQGLTELADLYGNSLAQELAHATVVLLRPLLPDALWGFKPPNAVALAHADPGALQAFVAAAARLLEQPIMAGGAQWQLALQTGMARFPEDGREAEQVVACAALAARSRGSESDPTQPTLYGATLGEHSRRRRRMAVELRRALRNGEIDVHFQPIVPASAVQGVEVIHKFEALSRWQLDGAPVSPAEFIPIVESAGLSGALLHHVLQRACGAIVALRGCGIESAMTVNVPAVASVMRRLPDDLLGVCAAHGVAPSQIGIEITESTFFDDDAGWRATFTRLREMGVQVAIDDFGTGFNSLACLERLPADTLKLDRTFIGQIFTSERQALICATLIRLAHDLGLKVVAEGVEEETQRTWLRHHGCDELQGYLLGRPAPLSELLQRARGAMGRVA